MVSMLRIERSAVMALQGKSIFSPLSLFGQTFKISTNGSLANFEGGNVWKFGFQQTQQPKFKQQPRTIVQGEFPWLGQNRAFLTSVLGEPSQSL